MPYAPGISYHGDQYLYRSLAGLGEQAGNAIREYRDRKRESEAADAAFETLVRTAAPMVQSGQVPAEFMQSVGDLGKFSGLSASAKKAKLGQLGVSLQLLMQDADRQGQAADRADANALRRSMFELQQQEAQRSTRRQDATGRAVLGMAPALDMPAEQADGVMGTALVGALRENPEADALAVLDSMTRAQRYRERPGGETFATASEIIEPFAVAGRTGLYNRRTGQMDVDQNPSDGRAATLRDEAGNVIGYGVRSGNRTVVVRPPDALSARDRIALMKEKSQLTSLLSFATKPADKAFIQEQMAAIDAELESKSSAKPDQSKTPSGTETPPRRRYNPATRKLE